MSAFVVRGSGFGFRNPAGRRHRYHGEIAITIWTIGHSTRTIQEFVTALTAYEIELLVDVRRFPGSRRMPHFSSEALDGSLAAHGIAYRWIPALGGRRRPEHDSVNDGWKNEACRGYADHVATEEFAGGLFELLTLADGLRTAVMCAELLWWQCHRRIIADVLASLDITVVHIRDESKSEMHRIAPPARFDAGGLSYATGNAVQPRMEWED
jgi:uncharacterized protein (DUF488 family)